MDLGEQLRGGEAAKPVLHDPEDVPDQCRGVRFNFLQAGLDVRTLSPEVDEVAVPEFPSPSALVVALPLHAKPVEGIGESVGARAQQAPHGQFEVALGEAHGGRAAAARCRDFPGAPVEDGEDPVLEALFHPTHPGAAHRDRACCQADAAPLAIPAPVPRASHRSRCGVLPSSTEVAWTLIHTQARGPRRA
ncbi:MAG: hypothetical protein ACE5FB_03135 [Candidatus Binatia bacterium]